MAVFELLVYQRNSTVISIGRFTLVNAPIVQIVLPAIVAFVIYDGLRLSVRRVRLEGAYMELTRVYAPMQRSNDLDLLTEPNLPSMWAIGASGMGGKGNADDRFMRRVNMVVSNTMMFAVPVIFECQAYFRLVQKFGYHNILLWITAVITALFGICTTVYVWLTRFGND